jgi:hypothetical protein
VFSDKRVIDRFEIPRHKLSNADPLRLGLSDARPHYQPDGPKSHCFATQTPEEPSVISAEKINTDYYFTDY